MDFNKYIQKNIKWVMIGTAIILLIAALFLFLIQREPETEVSEEPVQVETEVESDSSYIVTLNDNNSSINPQIHDRIVTYYEDLFSSLADLKADYILDNFYQGDPSAKAAGLYDQTFLETLIAMRSEQPTDLTIDSYSVDLTITDVKWLRDYDIVQVTLLEDQDIVFSGSDGVHSVSDNIENIFRLENHDGEWKISRHTHDEDVFLLIHDYLDDMNVSPADQGVALSQIKKDILSRALPTIEKQKQEREALSTLDTIASHDNGTYDREAAVAYANEYALTRNLEYPAYDEVGGNCNNFISQSLVAGGLNMDITGEDVWSYDQWGPTSSWTLVDSFYNYAVYNNQAGFKAIVTDNLYSGQPGDILQYGENNDWKHSVIITDVIKDEDGNVIDYLISSNTTDRQNYPASAYGYPQLRLIKIVGNL